METGMQDWSDQKVRHEIARRRLLYLALSIAVSSINAGVIAATGSAKLGTLGVALIALALGANIILIFWLFRWMSIPSKERARRRRLSVLKMLGVDDEKAASSGVGVASSDGSTA
jgi:hypothetical protein